MNLEIETALSSWLRAQPAFDGVPVHTGQSADTIPNDVPVLLVGVESTELVALSLYKVSASIVLASPSLVADALEAHTALADSLRSALLAPTDIEDAFPSSLTLAGADLRTWAESQQDGRWLTTATLSLGLVAI
jgi:hypothetical protein